MANNTFISVPPVTVSTSSSSSTVSIVPLPGTSELNLYNEISSVGSGIETLIQSYSVPSAMTLELLRVEVNGDNVAQYNIYVDGMKIASTYTYFCQFNYVFNFEYLAGSGLPINAGQLLEIKVLQNRPDLGDYSARISGILGV